MRKWIDMAFEIGDQVYLKTDIDQRPRIVVGIILRESGHLYQLVQGTIISDHYTMEISKEVNVLIKSTND